MAFNAYDLSHSIGDCMKMGRLKVIDWIPVIAGDKVSANYNAFVRTSPTRYPLKTAFRFEWGVFYMPYRQLIGSAQTATYRSPAAWAQEVIRMGKGDSSGINNIRSLAIPAAGAAGIEYEMSGFGINGAEPIREHLANLYFDVVNEYFRDKQYHRAINTGRWRQRFEASGANNWEGLNGLVTSTTEMQRAYANEDYARFGKIIGNLSDLFTRPITAYDPQLGNVPAQSQLNLVALDQQKIKFRREVDQSINTREYQQYLRHVWSGMVSDEAEYKPQILGTGGWWQDQFDVDATDGANLGQMTGKSARAGNFGFPNRFFPEHGIIMVACWARFPLILARAKNRMVNVDMNDVATLTELLADPAQVAAQVPQEWKVEDFVYGGSTGATGFSYPYADSYRKEAAKIHPFFEDRDVGFPVVHESNADARHLIECPVNVWEQVFRSTRLAHLQLEIQAEKMRYSMLPEGGQSIYAGTH